MPKTPITIYQLHLLNIDDETKEMTDEIIMETYYFLTAFFYKRKHRKLMPSVHSSLRNKNYYISRRYWI